VLYKMREIILKNCYLHSPVWQSLLNSTHVGGLNDEDYGMLGDGPTLGVVVVLGIMESLGTGLTLGWRLGRVEILGMVETLGI